MLTMLLLGAAMIIVTTMIHAGFMIAGIGVLRDRLRGHRFVTGNWRPAFVVSLFVLWMFLASVVEVWIWAALYLLLDVFDSAEAASYFSTVTLTTLGYGDIVLAPPFRILASFQAANGLFLFGWSTALVFAIIQQLYGSGPESPAQS